MGTTVIESAESLDQETLDALRQGVAGVLAELCGSTDPDAFIDGKNALDRDLWSQDASLGWLGFGNPEQYGGLGLGCHGLAILNTELGRQAAPGPYVATLSAAQAIVEKGSEAIRAAWLPRIASGEISAAVPASRSKRLDVVRRGRLGRTAVPGCARCCRRSRARERRVGDRPTGRG